MREFSRVLKPFGAISLIVEEGQGETIDHLGRYKKLYQLKELIDFVQVYGFKVLEVSSSYSDKTTFGKHKNRKWLHVIAQKSDSLQTDQKDNECVFCVKNRFQLESQIGIASSGSILWGDNNLYVTPDIAPLVEGHLLIITSNHYRSFGALPNKYASTIHKVKNKISKMLKDVYKMKILFYEHGPSEHDELGSCINHAHLHCIPVSEKLQKAIENHLNRYSKEKASINTLYKYYQSRKSYLYIEDDQGEGNVFLDDFIPSQILRDIVGTELCQKVWDWKLSYITKESIQKRNNTLIDLIPKSDDTLLSMPED
jgi:diadenosine tetraphosphate (Ap4A) HIT family hydrolase